MDTFSPRHLGAGTLITFGVKNGNADDDGDAADDDDEDEWEG